MPGLLVSLTPQAFSGKPEFTEKDVVIAIGANTGVGNETAWMAYARHARVYTPARSEVKTRRVIRRDPGGGGTPPRAREAS
ncbi:putative short-chain dehydrogenase protein [Rosellinia necatrix]|uniref:Putative short-chain dehydrogenase protein n=1 Tax=Rosellinia necatrix TaxID=77044 RepID=A0A1S8AAA6_ROSNE|nr:putative short-chain dehydrogenase protein [Rosellinia necatrix]